MASPGGLPELDDLEQLEQEETRSISSARSQRRSKASETRAAAASQASSAGGGGKCIRQSQLDFQGCFFLHMIVVTAMPKLNLGRNMAVMNKMLEKQAVKGGTSARGGKTRKKPATPGSAGGKLALINEQRSFATDSSLDSVELAERAAMMGAPVKKEKKTMDQMRAEVGGKDREYEASKEAKRLLSDFELSEVEIKQCKRLIDRRRPNPLGSYTNRDFLKIFVVNNIALLVLGFFFSAYMYEIFPGGGGFRATYIQADSIRVAAPEPDGAPPAEAHKASIVSTTGASALVLQGGISAQIAYGEMVSLHEPSTPSYEMRSSPSRGGTLDLKRRDHDGKVTNLVSFASNEMRINAGVPFDPENSDRTPDRLVKISEAGGAVSLGGSMFMMPQGFLGNGSIAVAPQHGQNIFMRPVGDEAVMRVNAGMSLSGSLRVGKDLQSDEPCARGVTVHVEPEEQSVQFGSEFNKVDVHLEGRMSHRGDIIVQNGGLQMGSGDLTVANFDVSRARKASFRSRKVRLGIKHQLNDPRVDIRGHVQFLDARGKIYLSLDPVGLGYMQARNMIVQNDTWLQGNVIIGEGKRDPMAGWVLSCDLQRRGGGAGSCDTATDYRLQEDAGLLQLHIRAGDTSMVMLNVSGDVCVGQQCVTRWTVNSTVPKGLMTVVGNLQFGNDHGDIVGSVMAQSQSHRGRASVFGRYSVTKDATLKSGIRLTGAQDGHATLRVLGPTVSAGPVHMTGGTLQVVGSAGFANAHTLRVEVSQLLTVCSGMGTMVDVNGSVICPPRFVVDTDSASLWANGSATVAGTTTLMQDVALGTTNSTQVEAFGRVETMHALQAGSMNLSPRVNHHVAWNNGTLEKVTYEHGLDGWWSNLDANYTVVDVYQRRGMNISASLTARDFFIGPRRNRTYVDMGWQYKERDWERNDTLSTFRVAGSSGMKSLTTAGLLRVASEYNSTTLFAANSGAGDTMVRESLTTRGHSIVNGAEFGPVEVYGYTVDFENSSVYDWAVQEDPRCYMSSMPGHVCDMAQHWNQYECFSLWQQDSLSRTEECTVQFNTTRANINIRVPLEQVYYDVVVPDPLFPEMTIFVPVDPPVFLRTLAPADTTIRSSLHVNRSANLKTTAVRGSAGVVGSATLNGDLSVIGNVTAKKDVNVTGKLFSAHMGHLKYSVVPDAYDSTGGGVVFTYGGLHVNDSARLLQTVEFGESPVDKLQILASSRFNNSLHTADATITASLHALSPVKMFGNLQVLGNVSMGDVTIVGNMVFETDVYRTFIVEAWSRTTTSSGNIRIRNNGSMMVDNLVSSPALSAGTLYIAQVNGSTPAGALIEGVPIVAGGIARPRVDELEAQYDEGILVDGVTCKSGTVSTFQQEQTAEAAAQARNDSSRGALVSMVNSGHARYMTDTVSSLAFFHHGHPTSALSGSELSHQSASLTVGTESNWNEALESHNAFLLARTVSEGVLRERFRVKANGDTLFNDGLGEIVAATGRVTVRGDFNLLQRRAIVVTADTGGPDLTGNQTGNQTTTGNLTAVVTNTNTTASNRTDTEEDDSETDEDAEIDPAFLVPKLMQVSSNESSVTATVSSGGNTKSSLQLGSAQGVFDMAFMREQEVVKGADSCTTQYTDTGSVLRIRGTQKELMSIGTSDSEAYVWNRGSAMICNASAESCDISVLSAQEANVKVTSAGGDATLSVQSGWSHRVRVSFVDSAQNGRNSTFHLTASESHVCRDDFEWADPYSGKNCRYYREQDPGCVITKSNPRLPSGSDPLVPCIRTCEFCEDGMPIPYFDFEGNDGATILHIEDLGDTSFAELHGDVVFGYCSARDHFGRCAATPRDVSLTIYSHADTAKVHVTSSQSDALLRFTSGAYGAAGVRFAQPTAADASSAFQVAKRRLDLEFTDSQSNLLAKIATTQTSSVGDLYVSGSATFGSLTNTTHSILVQSSRAAKCEVQSRSTAAFAVHAGYGRNASFELVTPRSETVQDGNNSIVHDAGVSQFLFINDGAGLTIQQKTSDASGNSTRVRNVLSLVSAGSQGDLAFDGDGIFCSTETLGAAACGVRVESAGRAEVSVLADNGTSDVSVVPGEGSRAVLDLQTRSVNGTSRRVVRLWTNPANGSLILSSGLNDTLMLTLQRVPGKGPTDDDVVQPSGNNTNATGQAPEDLRVHYGFVNVLGNGNFGVNTTKSAVVSLRSANSSRVLVGSTDGSPNASALLSVQSNTGAYLSLQRAANGSVATTFNIVARTDDAPCSSTQTNSTHNQSRENDTQPCDRLATARNSSADDNSTTRLFLETGAWSVLSIEPRTVPRHIQQHSIYQLTASEFFCKVSFVQVVESCAGSAPDPQAAWGSLLLRECTVPCYVNLMPWFTACGAQLDEFEELGAEQVGIINMQRTVCADYYGPYTGANPLGTMQACLLLLR